MTYFRKRLRRNKIKSAGNRRVLFLGYDHSKTRLIAEISAQGFEVVHSERPLKSYENFEIIISFGYRHIIPLDVIANSLCPIVNLHISLLPWNRGAHPVFWALFDNTPLGVTIHEIDEGLDTGPIIAQKELAVETDSLTFEQVHHQLVRKIEELFMNVFGDLISGTYKAIPQLGRGSSHKIRDLPTNFSGWGSNVKREISKLKDV
jgi:folate-dependent phosphoribosylglycinamide formyltransferase PurN